MIHCQIPMLEESLEDFINCCCFGSWIRRLSAAEHSLCGCLSSFVAISLVGGVRTTAISSMHFTEKLGSPYRRYRTEADLYDKDFCLETCLTSLFVWERCRIVCYPYTRTKIYEQGVCSSSSSKWRSYEGYSFLELVNGAEQ